MQGLSVKGFSRAGATPTIIGSVTVLNSNSDRVGATFVNDSDTVIYLSLSDVAVVNTGIRLNASGGSYEITMENPWTGPVSMACAAAAKNLIWTESQ